MPNNIDSSKVLYKKSGDDENYTPRYAVNPILEFLDRDLIVWCPFDKEDSEFVKAIDEHGNRVVYSHLDTGQDFFKYEPDFWDVIISNPPFANKRAFFERALDFNKPFALIMTLVWLNDSTPKKIYMDRGAEMQLLMFDKRIKFTNPGGRPNNKITFSSAYYCRDFLPRQIVLRELDVPK